MSWEDDNGISDYSVEDIPNFWEDQKPTTVGKSDKKEPEAKIPNKTNKGKIKE